MNEYEYKQIQNQLKKKLENCNGFTGKRKEGFEEGIKCAMSMLHALNKHSEKGENK